MTDSDVNCIKEYQEIGWFCESCKIKLNRKIKSLTFFKENDIVKTEFEKDIISKNEPNMLVFEHNFD